MDFSGSNEAKEIETLEEFYDRAREFEFESPSSFVLKDWVFQAVDFSSVEREEWDRYDVEGAWFHGCTFPEGVDANSVRLRGASVLEQDPALPFKMFRSFMYTQAEMREVDTEIYKWSRACKNLPSRLKAVLAQTAHDYSIKDALFDYVEGKSLVAVMGGHGMKRATVEYKRVVELGWSLARAGFVVVTGGGPGAMEAANMGAYLAGEPRERLDRALELISSESPHALEFRNEFEDTYAPKLVLREFGEPKAMPSLGIPTWFYGHEPPNLFASMHAKMFCNATREDCIISVANCGVVYNPGAAGTLQEIFQDACKNHYAEEEKARPMVFLAEKFWREHGAFDLLKKSAGDRPYSQMLMCTDDVSRVVQHYTEYRQSRSLPIVDLKNLDKKWWEARRDAEK